MFSTFDDLKYRRLARGKLVKNSSLKVSRQAGVNV